MPTAGSGVGEIPFPGWQSGICWGSFTLKPSSFPSQSQEAPRTGCSCWAEGGLEILHIIPTVQGPEHHWDPQCPPGQREFC